MAENNPRSHRAHSAYQVLDPAQHAPEANPYFVHAITGTQQFTFLGDTDHSDMSIPAFVARDDTMAAMQAVGVKNIFIERPSGLDHLAQELANGKITRQQFVDEMSKSFIPTFQKTPEEIHRLNETTADMIINAKNHGIRVRFADSDTSMGFPTSPERIKLYNEITKSLQDRIAKDKSFAGLSPQDQLEYEKKFVENYIEKLSPEQREHAQELMLHERLQADRQVAQNIGMTAGGQRSAIFYGWQHGSGFIGELGPGQIGQVALYGNDPNMRNFCPPGTSWNGFYVNEHPSTDAPASSAMTHSPPTTATPAGPPSVAMSSARPPVATMMPRHP